MNTKTELTREQIEALKAAALAATPQDIDSAQEIYRYEDGSHYDCPACGGEGSVPRESEFCNYDGEALGVQFYGIGNAVGSAEGYFRAVKPATVLALIDRLERAEAALSARASEAAAGEPVVSDEAKKQAAIEHIVAVLHAKEDERAAFAEWSKGWWFVGSEEEPNAEGAAYDAWMARASFDTKHLAPPAASGQKLMELLADARDYVVAFEKDKTDGHIASFLVGKIDAVLVDFYADSATASDKVES